ncbi:primosomal protein N' [Chryseolinea sp. T2]|uniref:replication restart helicase PriA n=1 Tax=Chryseolinea sp. T2 TaxID=3129255 RepID=UPI00307893BD
MEENTGHHRITLFAELLLPVPVPRLFTYRVPFNMNDRVMKGQRAIVQFGDRKILTGVILNLHEQPPTQYEAKYLLELLDEFPVVTDVQLKLFQWIKDYYLCSLGEVLNAGLPSGLKLGSESRVQLHPAFNLEESNLPFSEKELILLKNLEADSLDYSAVSKLLDIKHPYSILKSLVAKEAVILYEEVREKYKPKTEMRVRLTSEYATPEALEALFNTLSLKPKQEEVVLRYLQEVPILTDANRNKAGLGRKQLLEPDLSESSLNTLIKNGVFELFQVLVSRFADAPTESGTVSQLSDEQHAALVDITNQLQQKPALLLHGITGSGKTEVYIHLIRQALEGGNQVLYLLPEIALTTQVVQRLRRVFGNSMGVYHSRFSDNERVEIWKGVLNGNLKFIVGVRSSIFLPFDSLGLIIVDEEHDASYKQQEPAPRYNARDVALVMGQFHHAKVILGSATPSLESWFQAQQGKYGYVSLSKRFGSAQLPTVVLADMHEARIRKTIKGEFSQVLLRHIAEALSRKEQVIVFQNRRGYSPMVNCEDCGWVPKCINCAVSLTYHQYRRAMICHYCGYRESLPEKCPSCSSTRLKTVGYGTEKLEEELTLQFPDASVRRMDLDTTRNRTAYESIIDEFEKGETNILVGTQMVTKGLDFDGVSLVGIFNADRMIHFPDFRSYERAFQLITQVSGRAGRRSTPGTVVIQTSSVDHPLLQTILRQDILGFYGSQLEDRKVHGYPPFTRLIEVTVKHSDKATCRNAALDLFERVRRGLASVRVLGPGEPMVAKVRNQYLMNILIKVPRAGIALDELKKQLEGIINSVLQSKSFKNLRIIADVDPV